MTLNPSLRALDPLALLEEFYPPRTLGSTQPQARRSRLYLAACARKQWARLPLVGRVLVGLAEGYADAPREEKRLYAAVAMRAEELFHSAGTAADFRSAESDLVRLDHLAPVVERARREAGAAPDVTFAPDEWRGLAALLYLPFEPKTPSYSWVPVDLHDVELLRDVHGDPSRRVPFPAAWRTTDALSLARGIYAERAFDRMPILADALQDADCDDEEILNHCRDPHQRHARGCWVLDLVLEKK